MTVYNYTQPDIKIIYDFFLEKKGERKKEKKERREKHIIQYLVTNKNLIVALHLLNL